MAWNWLLSLIVMSANVWKSLSSIAVIIFSVLAGTEYSALYLMSSLVLTLFLMPRELEVVFLWSLATQMITLRPGQWEAGLSCWATLSTPSSRFPITHLTKPPYTDLQADPDPRLARALSSPRML